MGNSRRFRSLRLCLQFLPLAFVGIAHAGSIAAEPLRLTVQPGAHSASLSVQNPGNTPVQVQAKALSWSQRDGEEVLDASAELKASPSAFTLAPGAAQDVRVTLERPNDAAGEHTYRLFLTEIPQPREPGELGPTVAVRLSLPVFVLPLAGAAPRPVWRIAKGPQGEIVLSMKNVGNAHIQAISARFFDDKGKLVGEGNLGGYALPGQSRTWHLRADHGWDHGRISLVARTDAGDVSANVSAE